MTDWQSQYRYTTQPHVMDDFVDRCIVQQMLPESRFTPKRICSLAVPEWRITLSDRRLITTLQSACVERELAPEVVSGRLGERFGITL